MAFRRCRASHPFGLQCEGEVTDLTTHIEDHWATRSDGTTVHWDDDVAALVQELRKVNVSTTARDAQVGGQHYRQHEIQPWDIIDEYKLNYYEGQVLKYLLRRKAGRLEDLKKARHVLDKLIELEKDRDGGT